MGATESKPKIINQKLSLRYEDMNIKDLDNFFNSALPSIREVEIIRCKFIFRWNEFVRLSGGIVLKNPRFESCVQGMLWKLSADMNGNLSSIEILENEPFILFKNQNFLKDEDVQISQSFQELCRFYLNNYDNVMKLESALYKRDKDTRAYRKDQESLLNDRNVSLMEMGSYTKRLTENCKKVCYAYEVIFEIRKCFEEIRKGLIKYSKWTKEEPATIKKIEEVGILAKQKSISRPAKIMYKYSKEEKLGEYEEHFDLIQDDLKAEKEARSILDLSSRKITVLSSNLREPLKETILLTDLSAHKDTAESLTEIIPIKTEEITTDVVKKKIINRSDIQDYTSDKREVTMRPSATEYNRINYKSEIVGSNMLNPSVIVSSNEKPMGSSYIIDKESFPGKGTIITQTESTEMFENYDRLKREADDLTRKNAEMNMRLESGKNLHGSSGVQNHVRMQNALTPMETVTHVSKYPNYQKNHVPIKNWNFSIHKIITATEPFKINRIEPIMDIGLIAAATQKGQLIFWKISDLENIQEEKVLSISPNIPIKSMLYLNDGNTLLCGSGNGRIYKISLNNLLNNHVEEICDLEHSINSMVYTFNGYSILASSQNKIYEIDIVNNKIIDSIEAHDDTITDMVYNMQKEMFVTCSKDNNIKIWHSKTKECLGIMQGHSAPVISICFAYSQDHIYLVSIGKDSFITFWNLTNRNLTRTYELSDMAAKVVYLWDKKTVLAVHKNGVFTLWDLEKEESKDFFNEKFAYNNGCYLNNGHNIVLTTAEGNLEFWNAD